MLRQTKELLKSKGISSFAIDAELLICHVLGDITREQLLLKSRDLILNKEQEERLSLLLARRIAGEPIAYIIGHKEFWGVDFLVTPDTLIPRPDSETLIETALSLMDPQLDYRILDLGTGSGCLLLSLLKEIPKSRGVGVDISAGALTVARKNAAYLKMGSRANFILSDWWQNVSCNDFDLIASNPPYIPKDNPVGLEINVAKYEPENALFGGNDGMESYRIIASRLGDFLSPKGVAIFEFGSGQEQQIQEIFIDFKVIKVGKDLSGRPRCIAIKKI